MKYLLFFLPLLVGCGPGSEPTEPATPSDPPEPVERVSEVRAVAAADDPDGDAPEIPSLAYLTGRFDPADHPAFERVADEYTDGDPYLLHRDTYTAFRGMHAAAAKDGVRLVIRSATRNFDRQRQIWEAKWRGERLLEGTEKADEVYPEATDRARAILRYSSMPGTSRHHWGTDVDLNAFENSYFASGEGRKVYEWLTAHAADYGFCQPYTAKGELRPHGYEEERWHWSYLPLATRLTDFARRELRDTDIGGFAGAEAAPGIRVIERYVLGINPDCRQ